MISLIVLASSFLLAPIFAQLQGGSGAGANGNINAGMPSMGMPGGSGGFPGNFGGGFPGSQFGFGNPGANGGFGGQFGGGFPPNGGFGGQFQGGFPGSGGYPGSGFGLQAMGYPHMDYYGCSCNEEPVSWYNSYQQEQYCPRPSYGRKKRQSGFGPGPQGGMNAGLGIGGGYQGPQGYPGGPQGYPGGQQGYSGGYPGSPQGYPGSYGYPYYQQRQCMCKNGYYRNYYTGQCVAYAECPGAYQPYGRKK